MASFFLNNTYFHLSLYLVASCYSYSVYYRKKTLLLCFIFGNMGFIFHHLRIQNWFPEWLYQPAIPSSMHKTRYMKSNRRQSGKESWAHEHRGKFPEQNNNSLCLKIKNWHMGHHKIAKLLSIGQYENQQIVKRTLPILYLIQG